MNQYENEYIGDLLCPGPEIYSTKEEIEQEITEKSRMRFEISGYISKFTKKIAQRLCDLDLMPSEENIADCLLFLDNHFYGDNKKVLKQDAEWFYTELSDKVSFIKE